MEEEEEVRSWRAAMGPSKAAVLIGLRRRRVSPVPSRSATPVGSVRGPPGRRGALLARDAAGLRLRRR